ncbi:MAG: hypothetical protein SFZ03_01965 [Candidatus Melainabacteria bacterium]|nr:hypothetical protein [Candidatus Melainabacteria bacterium]
MFLASSSRQPQGARSIVVSRSIISRSIVSRSLCLLALCGVALCHVGLGGATAVSAAEPFKGSVVVTEDDKRYPTVNAEDLKSVDKGTYLNMRISTEITPGLTGEGDEFFGTVTKNYTVDGQVVIPRGTVIHGKVNDMTDPKWAGRNGHVTLDFDYMVTPDGREIPIDGGFTNKDGALKAAAKVVGRSALYTGIGGVAGALMVAKYGGVAAVAASEGYALAGGAAVGGAIGLTAAMVTKGQHAMIQPGAELKIKLKDGMQLPTVNMPDNDANNKALEGLEVTVTGSRLTKDPFGEDREMTVSVQLTNHTEHTFTFFDIALEDEYGGIHYASPFGDTGLWFHKLVPNSQISGNLTFNVNNPEAQHYLVFYKQYTREPLARVALSGGTQELGKQNSSRRHKAKR